MDVFELIKRHEGFRAKVYTDTRGCTTIGYGFKVSAITAGDLDAIRPEPDRGPIDWPYFELSEAEATIILSRKVRSLAGILRINAWWAKLNDVRQAVMLDMAYNLGLDGLLAFHETLDSLRRGEWVAAARQMLASEWAKEVGHRALEDAALMAHGEWAVLADR